MLRQHLSAALHLENVAPVDAAAAISLELENDQGDPVLAASTALPEVSTGIASVRMGDYQLAVSDIFGGNAFLPVLFLWAGLLSGTAVLPQITAVDIYLTGLVILLTVVFVWGLIARPQRRIGPIGVDSAVALALYLVGMIGFATFAGAI